MCDLNPYSRCVIYMNRNQSEIRVLWNRNQSDVGPPKNGVIALWPNTRVVKCKYYVSQNQNGFNNKIHWYGILLTFMSRFTARLQWTKICVLSNLSN